MNLSYEQFIGALCIWREARGTTVEAQKAIWHVLLNRVNEPKKYGTGLVGVVLKPYQFSSFNSNDPNASKLPNPANTADYKPWPVIMDLVTNSQDPDPTKGATHYESCDPDKLPAWADKSKLTVTVGPFRFYKL